ncbi:hypothetical protein T552_02294 [Pneumocystis carinii B80]|uniref:SEC7 domain-containing protein n=1 Tax=Pneumocystis carinii (strain B80) TaxID=1408658 RepID=A0A0W4ZG04_PNEC8|nr:hypothetical protein T552_02294 [Pneumocystis carinii B80]KTW27312.1 hypothetical protein T552_02294 [Pneumocystis carinii B80]
MEWPCYYFKEGVLCSNDALIIINESSMIISVIRKNIRDMTGGTSVVLGEAFMKVPDEKLWVDKARNGRKNGIKSMENSLLYRYSQLKSSLIECKDVSSIDTLLLLDPFIYTIENSSIEGSIKSLALSSIMKFISYGVINKDSLRLSLGIKRLISALIRYISETLDLLHDETVLLKMFRLIEQIIISVIGRFICDSIILEIIEVCLNVFCRLRLSKVLRKSVEMTMLSLIQSIFGRLKEITLKNKKIPFAILNDQEILSKSQNLVSSNKKSESLSSEKMNYKDEFIPENNNIENSEQIDEEIVPYGIISIKKVFYTLILLLEPHDRQHTDTVHIIALRMINTAIEVSGPVIEHHPDLCRLITDDLCKYLFQLIQSDNLSIIFHSFQIISLLLHTIRPFLKFQQEVFLKYAMSCFSNHNDIKYPSVGHILYQEMLDVPKHRHFISGKDISILTKEQRKLGNEESREVNIQEIIMECILGLIRIPSFINDLFVNYDCEINMCNLCEDLIDFFIRNIFSDPIIWSKTNIPLLSLQAILILVEYISERLNIEENKESSIHKFPSLETLLEKKNKKATIIQGSIKFNEKPREGIKYLQNNGILDKNASFESIALFLKNTSYVNKKLLGIYLSKLENSQVLDCFINTFDFHGKRIEEALREVLSFFRLPGESQQIERILEKFSNKYFETNPVEIETVDATFVLAYSIAMLNVDLHNTQVKKRMTIEEYTKNLRNLNNNKDFDPEYLKAIYESIRSNEIIVPNEHNSQLGFEYTWRNLTKLCINKEFRIYNTNIYDQYIFEITWKPIISSFTYAFISSTDDNVLYYVVNGFNHCAKIASQYKISEVIDYIISCLLKVMPIDDNELKNISTNLLINIDGNDIYVNSFSIKFGENFKAKLAATVLFRISNGNESLILEGWKEIFKLLFIFFINHLLSPSFTQIQNYVSIPPIVITSKVKNGKKIDENKSIGLLSALSSYLSGYGTNDGFIASETEIESAISTAECIKSCHIESLYKNMMSLDLNITKQIMDFLLQPFSQDLFMLSNLRNSSQDSLKSNSSNNDYYLKYDEIILLRMEIATCLVLRDVSSLKEFSQLVTWYLLNSISNSDKIHNIVRERFIIYLLRIVKEDIDKDINQLKISSVFNSLASLNDSFIIEYGLSISNGILEIIKLSKNQEYISSSHFLKLLSLIQKNEEAIPVTFQIVQHLSSQKLSKESFQSIIFLLNQIINYTSINKKHDLERIRSLISEESQILIHFIDYATQSINILYQLHLKALSLFSDTELEFKKVWEIFWAPIFNIFQEQCTNIFYEVRQEAFTCLQKSLLSSQFSNDENLQWILVFKEILFPLIFRLLKPEIYQLDLQGMAQARIQAVTLLCKVYLHYLVKLSKYDGMLDLWINLLDIIDRLINSGQPDHLTEAVLESLKNVLLVMNTSGYLVPPSDLNLVFSENLNHSNNQFHCILWKETWNRINRFLPHLREELFPTAIHSN